MILQTAYYQAIAFFVISGTFAKNVLVPIKNVER